MKNYKGIALILALAFSVAACNDAIDIEQPGRLGADQAFSSVADLELGLLSTYANLDHTSEIQFNALFTDELSIGFDNGGQGIGNGTYGFILNPGSAISSRLWTRKYAGIVSANLLLEAADGVTPGDGEQADYDNIRAQALVLRAYAHFQLLSYYSPDLTDDSAPGVILVDFVPGVDQFLPRNSTGNVFAGILADLNTAAPLLTDATNATFISTAFVNSLKARIALYRRNYSEADAMAATVLADFPLANRAEYLDLFDDAGNTGVIFKMERTVGDGFDRQGNTGSANAGGWAGANFAFVNGTIDGSPYFEMGRALFNLLDPADIRYDANVHASSLINPDYATSADAAGTDILVVGKYTGSEGQPLMNDLKIFRSAEMLLIRVEAAIASSDLSAAATMIKQLRDARFATAQMLPVYASQQDAYAALLDERRIEFAFEGHRYLDLKRLGQDAGRNVQRDAIDCAINGACSLSTTDFRMRSVPVPLVELNANSEISQNPGY